MKTREIAVTSRGLGMHEALEMTETLAVESGLDQNQVLHLRLLAEELFGMLKGIAGDVEALYWMDIEGKSFEQHMKASVDMTVEMRDALLSAATSGKNEAAKSFMGRIRDMIGVRLLPSNEGPSELAQALMNAAWSTPGNNLSVNTSDVWSMQQYKSDVQSKREEGGEAKEAWDELEKSIVAKIADEVKISIVGSTAEITVFKAF